jgi:hypothetical protein
MRGAQNRRGRKYPKVSSSIQKQRRPNHKGCRVLHAI